MLYGNVHVNTQADSQRYNYTMSYKINIYPSANSFVQYNAVIQHYSRHSAAEELS